MPRSGQHIANTAARRGKCGKLREQTCVKGEMSGNEMLLNTVYGLRARSNAGQQARSQFLVWNHCQATQEFRKNHEGFEALTCVVRLFLT
jgi:hypothetical protein